MDEGVEFSGEERFAASPERLFAAVADLDALAETIPDLVSSERPDAQTLKCVVKPGFSFLRGTLRLTITLGDVQPPETAAMRVAAQGIGVLLEMSSRLRIVADGSGARLSWTARIERMGGLLASVSRGLVQAAADQTVRHAWQQVRRRLGE